MCERNDDPDRDSSGSAGGDEEDDDEGDETGVAGGDIDRCERYDVRGEENRFSDIREGGVGGRAVRDEDDRMLPSSVPSSTNMCMFSPTRGATTGRLLCFGEGAAGDAKDGGGRLA